MTTTLPLEQRIEILDGNDLDGAIKGYRTEQHTLLIRRPDEIDDQYRCELYDHGWVPGLLDPECMLIGCFDLADLESLIPLLIIARDRINELPPLDGLSTVQPF